ncbi:MAG: hypothetical protein LBM98_06705 [Oscillospiraceae bacterium]|nr:hypothetical protein [Oscillospiraceae bacterium]
MSLWTQATGVSRLASRDLGALPLSTPPPFEKGGRKLHCSTIKLCA